MTPTNWALDPMLHKIHYFTGPTLSEVTYLVSRWCLINNVGGEDDDSLFAADVSFSFDVEFGWSATVSYVSETQLEKME